ncbi:hypothetical protein [Flavobacterium sp. XS2P14]|uniref:hypothetical protein n=1 Tax=Flavobacterium sp. XS2P14 TaxID=3401735 RepID=UPI003AAE0CC7
MLEKFFGTLTLLSSIVWFGFFINGIDRNQIYFIFLIAGLVDLLLVADTKFWKDSYEQTTVITAMRIVCVLVNILLSFFLLKIMKSEVDLDDTDDVLLSILTFLAVVLQLYLIYTKLKTEKIKHD